MKLTAIEKRFLEAVAQGQTFDVSGEADNTPIIRAELIRNLYFNGIEIPNNRLFFASPRRITVADSGLRIKGATITGRINLDGLGRDASNGAPGLYLTNCHLSEGISAVNAILTELDLSGTTYETYPDAESALPPIHLNGARIFGSLLLNKIRGKTETTPVWVFANGCEIGKGIFATDAYFFYPPRSALGADDFPNYALGFGKASIKGGFNSLYGLICNGGLSFHTADVQGDIWLSGSHIIGGESSALRSQTLRLVGNLVFWPKDISDSTTMPARCEGELDLFGATISGGIYFSGLEITDHPHKERVGISALSLNLIKAKIATELSAKVWQGVNGGTKAFTCTGPIQLQNATIAGDINLIGATIGAIKDGNHYLTSVGGDDLHLGGNLIISSTKTKERSYIPTLSGMLTFDRASFDGSIFSQELKITDERSGWFLMRKAIINGELNLNSWDIGGGIYLSETKIQGDCTIKVQRATMDGFSKPRFIHVDLAKAKLGSSLGIYADVSNLNLFSIEVAKQVDLYVAATKNVGLMHARIGGSLYFRDFRFLESLEKASNDERNLLELKSASIAGNIKIQIPTIEDTSDLLITNAWSKPLTCYSGWTFIEVEINRSNGIWYASFLQPPEGSEAHSGLYLCNSRSLIFHQLNRENKLNLATEESAKEYLKLFCACTWGDEGAFVITEDASHLPFGHIDLIETNKLDEFDQKNIAPVEILPPNTPVVKADKDHRTPPADEAYLLKAYVRFGNGLFQAYFSIQQDGLITMLDDKQLLAFQKTTTHEYKKPLRKQNRFFTRRSDFVLNIDTDMTPLPKGQLDKLKESMEKIIKAEICPHNFSNAGVDLSDASISGLDDNDGAGWGEDVQLNLINFRYQHYSTDTRFESDRESFRIRTKRLLKNTIADIALYLAHRSLSLGFATFAKRLMRSRLTNKYPEPKQPDIRDRVRKRIRWLELQYPKVPETSSKWSARYWIDKLPYLRTRLPDRRVDLDLFEPQPYSQAAAVFRREGASDHARSIDQIQRKMSGRKQVQNAGLKRPWYWLLHWLFDQTSGYGLSPIRALLVTLFFVAFGGLMTSAANQKGLLIVDATPVVQSAPNASGKPGELSYTLTNDGWRFGEVLCGESIEPILYAADIFIPLLDIRQEVRCMIRPADSPYTGKSASAAATNTGWEKLVRIIAPLLTDNIEAWHWFRSLYSLTGWVMISLLIYTLSHNLRSRDTIS